MGALLLISSRNDYLVICWCDDEFYVRVMGYGFHVHPLRSWRYFSRRNKLKKIYRIGSFVFSWLRKGE